MALFSRKSPLASPARARFGREVAARLDATPGVVRAPATAAQIYTRPQFLEPERCDRLVELIDRGARPSTVLADRPYEGFRTSSSCDMDRWSPDVQPIDEAVAALLGIAPELGETMQGQRYELHQHFRAHHDYFHITESYWQSVSERGGQRTWTAMIYLNDVAEGGATWFPQAGVRIAPERGLLLIWNNMMADGSPNEATLHEGMPVLDGVKYIVTKWFRETRWIP